MSNFLSKFQKHAAVTMAILASLGTQYLAIAMDDQVDTATHEFRIPASAELKRYMLAVETFINEHNFILAEQYLDKASKLGLALPAEYHYFKGILLQQQQDYGASRISFEEYILQSDQDAPFFTKALERITWIETRQPTPTVEANARQEINWENSPNDGEIADYIDRLQNLYLETSAQTALIKHINGLLASVPLNSDDFQATQITTTVSITDDKKVKIQKSHEMDDGAQITSFSTPVYGLGSDFLVQCAVIQGSCVIKHKDSLNTWFEIKQDMTTAEEIAMAAKAMIIILQGQD